MTKYQSIHLIICTEIYIYLYLMWRKSLLCTLRYNLAYTSGIWYNQPARTGICESKMADRRIPSGIRHLYIGQVPSTCQWYISKMADRRIPSGIRHIYLGQVPSTCQWYISKMADMRIPHIYLGTVPKYIPGQKHALSVSKNL